MGTEFTAVDTETTGLDLYHGCAPFFVATFDGTRHRFWRWEVDPRTRAVLRPDADAAAVRPLVAAAPRLVGHNVKFDAGGMERYGLTDGPWPWARTDDTLVAAHVLESALPHDLTSMATRWLGVDVKPFEDRLRAAVVRARGRVQQARLARGRGKPKPPPEDALADWAIAGAGVPGMPSAGKEDWRADGWLAAELAAHDGLREPRADCAHRWVDAGDGDPFLCALCAGRREHVVLREYALSDVEVTWHLWAELRAALAGRGLDGHYRVRVAAVPWLAAMEGRGTTYDRHVLREVRTECRVEVEALERELVGIAEARDCLLTLPKAGRNASLDAFLFGTGTARCGTCGAAQPVRPEAVAGINARDGGLGPRCNFCAAEGRAGRVTASGSPGLGLEPVYNPKAKTAKPCFDAKLAVPHYLETLDPASDAYRFVRAYERRGHFEKAAGYCDAYEKFGLPLGGSPRWHVLHPTFNAAGTTLMRRSCSNPNLQQIGKKKEANLRRAFGPAPGREWWSLDYKNLELRLPAYESGERELIDLFENPGPPYWGSEHLLNFSTVYPDVWAGEIGTFCADKCCGGKAVTPETVGPHVKRKFEDTWYQWCKNGDFAVGYGAVDRAEGMGTADRTFRRPGSQARLKARFARKEALNQHWIAFARRHGYVETMPDRTVDPTRGYPLMVSRSDRGDVLPTLPLNYHVQGTAGWIQTKSIVRVGPVLAEWTRADPRGYYLVVEVHDELVFDFPAGTGPEPWRTNIAKVREVQRLMELGGDDVGVPTPVDVEWCPKNWAEGVTIKAGAEDAPPGRPGGPAAFVNAKRRGKVATTCQAG